MYGWALAIRAIRGELLLVRKLGRWEVNLSLGRGRVSRVGIVAPRISVACRAASPNVILRVRSGIVRLNGSASVKVCSIYTTESLWVRDLDRGWELAGIVGRLGGRGHGMVLRAEFRSQRGRGHVQRRIGRLGHEQLVLVAHGIAPSPFHVLVCVGIGTTSVGGKGSLIATLKARTSRLVLIVLRGAWVVVLAVLLVVGHGVGRGRELFAVRSFSRAGAWSISALAGGRGKAAASTSAWMARLARAAMCADNERRCRNRGRTVEELPSYLGRVNSWSLLRRARVRRRRRSVSGSRWCRGVGTVSRRVAAQSGPACVFDSLG